MQEGERCDICGPDVDPYVELLVECSSTHTTLWLEIREAEELIEALKAGIADAKRAPDPQIQTLQPGDAILAASRW